MFPICYRLYNFLNQWGVKGISLNMSHLTVMDFVVSLWLIGTRLSEHLLVSEHMAIRFWECQHMVAGGSHYYLSNRTS